MIQNVIALLAVLASIVVVFLNYWREIRTKRESEIYLRKQKFYEDLINHFNRAFYQRDTSYGMNLVHLYNKSFIIASDDVIDQLNIYFDEFGGKKVVPTIDVKDRFAKLIIACRKDLGFSNKMIDDYRAPFAKRR